ncbi:hypothetical protein [Paraburkholderia sp. BCC1876]|uniref:hypothetical protein n=1 Tax=Paraburkholderia sp. BCC1876 TaxID=2676303 RepID=UPI001590637E|nr:hypothetical protein [Paraburkholderia sp. BCC1876]
MSSTSRASARVAIVLAAIGILMTPALSHAERPHLTVDEIDQLSRDRVVRQLKGGADSAPQAASGASLGTPLPVPADPAAAQKTGPLKRVESPRSRAEPVNFVGAYSDASGGYVLYEMGGGVYPAHLGTKLMNGWTAEKVSGFLVTVSQDRRVWTEPIRGGAASGVVNTPTLQAISDLGGPLPPGAAMATPIYSGK